jgi:hypothetical protein
MVVSISYLLKKEIDDHLQNEPRKVRAQTYTEHQKKMGNLIISVTMSDNSNLFKKTQIKQIKKHKNNFFV